MKKRLIFTLIIASIIFIIVASFIVLSINHPSDSQQLKTLIETEWTQYKSNKTSFNGDLSILITSPDGYYFASTGNITADTHFRAASTTKTFTAAAILLLQQQGKLQINDKITGNIPGTNMPYVPDLPSYAIPFKNEITIKQLLEHRAGVFDVSNTLIPDNASAPYAGKYYLEYVKEILNQPNHTFTFDELVGVVASNNLSYFPPGTAFHYSNTGCSILGKIIERVSGMSYTSFVNQYLLAPNGLSDSSLPVTGTQQQLPTPYVDGYIYVQGVSYQVTEDNMSPHVAEGNLVTTPNNLGKWVKQLYSAKAGLNQTFMDLMKDVQPTGEEHDVYGLCTTYTDGLGYGHNGAHIGYLTVMRYDPATDVTVVIFASNLNADDTYGQLYFMYDVGRLAKQLLGYDRK